MVFGSWGRAGDSRLAALPQGEFVTRFHVFASRPAWKRLCVPVYPSGWTRGANAGDGGFGMTDVKKICARLGVVTMVALGASACSSIPDWVDPTTWVGGSDNSQTALPDPDAAAQAGESPDLAAIPDRPAPSSTPAQQQQVASSLASDRADAKYSADSLRGGTEPVAAPPPPASAPEPEV